MESKCGEGVMYGAVACLMTEFRCKLPAARGVARFSSTQHAVQGT